MRGVPRGWSRGADDALGMPVVAQVARALDPIGRKNAADHELHGWRLNNVAKLLALQRKFNWEAQGILEWLTRNHGGKRSWQWQKAMEEYERALTYLTRHQGGPGAIRWREWNGNEWIDMRSNWA